MKRLVISILTLAMTVLCAYDAAGQDTRAQESRKARLEREIAVIDKQLKDNAAKSSDAMATLNLVRKKVADRKELVAESDKEIATLNSRIRAKQQSADKVQERLDTLTLYYEKLVRNAIGDQLFLAMMKWFCCYQSMIICRVCSYDDVKSFATLRVRNSYNIIKIFTIISCWGLQVFDIIDIRYLGSNSINRIDSNIKRFVCDLTKNKPSSVILF